MKVVIIIFVSIVLFFGCASVPQEYLREPNESEIVYIKTATAIGIVMALIGGYAVYYYYEEVK